MSDCLNVGQCHSFLKLGRERWKKLRYDTTITVMKAEGVQLYRQQERIDSRTRKCHSAQWKIIGNLSCSHGITLWGHTLSSVLPPGLPGVRHTHTLSAGVIWHCQRVEDLASAGWANERPRRDPSSWVHHYSHQSPPKNQYPMLWHSKMEDFPRCFPSAFTQYRMQQVIQPFSITDSVWSQHVGYVMN